MSKSETVRSKAGVVEGRRQQAEAPAGKHQVTELKIPVPWGHIAVKAWNNPSGIPVLVIHGSMDNSGSFDRLIPLLPTTHYYVCVDLPSHGRSSHFPPGLLLDFFDFVRSVKLVADHFAWEKFTLMGHSLGGQVCAVFTAMYPQCVRALVMLDSLAPYVLSPDEFGQYYRRCVSVLLKLNGGKEPPCHTYEEALHRMVSKRVDTITTEAAKCLLERGVVKSPKGYSFSVDPRMRIFMPSSLGSKQTWIMMYQQISCPQLTIITNYTKTRIAIRKEFQIIWEMLSQRNNFVCLEVEGNHDIHNINPEKVSKDISQFLIKQTSML